MSIKPLVIRVLLLGGLSLTACGAPLDSPPEPAITSQESAIWPCDGTLDFVVYYYSDPGFTQWTGTEACSCDGTYSFVGDRGRYRDSTSFSCG
jgi:hypothetical protein